MPKNGSEMEGLQRPLRNSLDSDGYIGNIGLELHEEGNSRLGPFSAASSTFPPAALKPKKGTVYRYPLPSDRAFSKAFGQVFYELHPT